MAFESTEYWPSQALSTIIYARAPAATSLWACVSSLAPSQGQIPNLALERLKNRTLNSYFHRGTKFQTLFEIYTCDYVSRRLRSLSFLADCHVKIFRAFRGEGCVFAPENLRTWRCGTYEFLDFRPCALEIAVRLASISARLDCQGLDIVPRSKLTPASCVFWDYYVSGNSATLEILNARGFWAQI